MRPSSRRNRSTIQRLPFVLAFALLLFPGANLPATRTTAHAATGSMPKHPLESIVLAGERAGQVDLPAGALAKSIHSLGRQLLVQTSTGTASEVLLFQSNPKLKLRLLWRKIIPQEIGAIRLAPDSVWILTNETTPQLIQLSPRSGETLSSGAFDKAIEANAPRMEARQTKPFASSASTISIALLATNPASAVLLDTRRPRRLPIYTGFLHPDAGFHFPDTGADDIWGVGCLGDSNTFSADGGGWCEQIPRHIPDPRLRIFNYASIGAQARGTLPRDGEVQLSKALREPAVDLVIASFGINDLRQGTSPQQLLAQIRAMARETRQAGKRFIPTTVAPYRGEMAGVSESVTKFNKLLRAAFGADAVIEFADGLPPDALDSDGVHVTARGHRLRRQAAIPHVYGTTTCRRGTPCEAPRICFHAGNSQRIADVSGRGYATLRGFLPQAACVRPTDIKLRAPAAAKAADVVWNALLQEQVEAERLEAGKKCMQSDECREKGNCDAVAVESGKANFECRPSRHMHCIESLLCRNENRCLNWFGECVEQTEDATPDREAFGVNSMPNVIE